MNAQALFLVLGWAAFGAAHSLLAGLRLKAWVSRRWPGFAPYYRLAYNAVAVAGVLPLLWVTASGDGPLLWRWPGAWSWLADGLALAAVAGFFWTLRYYDGAEFLGLRQWRGRCRDLRDTGRFRLSPLHRYVRHPWYSLALVIIWSREMDILMLSTAVAVTIYFILGARWEEKKLLAVWGDRYRRYRCKVPGLIPLPWKHLDRAEAAALVGESAPPPRSGH